MIAVPEQKDIKKVEQIFRAEGYHNIAVAKDSLDLILRCQNRPVDFLVIDMDFPFMDCMSTLRHMVEHKLCRIVIAVDSNWEKSRLTTNLDWIDIFVTKPIEARKIVPSLLVCLAQKNKMAQMEQEYRQAEEELWDQKISGYAVQLIMDKLHLSEEDAEGYLNQAALQNNKKVQDIFEIIYSVLCNKKGIIK